MQHHVVRCNDFLLSRWLTSNPVKRPEGNMTVVCGGIALMWPVVPRDAGEKREAA